MAYVGPSPRRPWGRKLPVSSGGVVGLAADILLDFVNNVYRVDGTTYATAALAGFTGTGTFNASGYTATGAQSLSSTIDLPGDFIVVCTFSPTPFGVAQLWAHQATTLYRIIRASGEYQELPAITGAAPTTASKIAFGTSGGLSKISVDSAPVVTGTSSAAPGSAIFRIGNDSSAGIPWGAPIQSLAIYKQTLTDAQMQALT